MNNMQKFNTWMKHFFIPHEGNDHQPHSLRGGALVKLGAIAIAAEVIALAGFFPIIDKQVDYFAAVFPSVLVDATNDSRNELALNTLAIDNQLTAAAQLKANDMAAKGYFAHNTPEGLTPWYFLDQVGYPYAAAGENLAVNFSDSYDAHRAWMNSPGHRANILRDQFTEIGIATAKGQYKGRSTIFVVQFFGRPHPRVVTQIDAQAAQTLGQQTVPQVPQTPREVLGESVVVEEVATETEIPIVAQSFTSTKTDDVLEENTKASPTVSLSTSKTYGSQASFMQKFLTSPHQVSTFVFITLGVLILIALVLKVVFHIKKQYMRLITNGIIFLLVLAALFMLNQEIAAFLGNIE